MPKTKKEFDQVKYQNQFINEKYDRINLTVPKGDKAVIKRKGNYDRRGKRERIY